MPEIRLEDVTKVFKTGDYRCYAVRNVNLTIKQGEFVFLLGSSGAGKSTLLRLMAGEIRPDSGVIWFNEREITRLSRFTQSAVKREVGQVWQDIRLMRKRTIRENLAIAMRAAGADKRRIAEDVPKALGIVGMRGVEDKYPVELSTGESKRVELARAIINNPPVLVMDEPTANLDNDTAWDIVQLLAEINRRGTTIVMATHASWLVNIMCRRVVTLADGRIIGDVRKGKYGDIV